MQLPLPPVDGMYVCLKRSCYYVTIVQPFMLLCHYCSAIQTDIKDKLDSKGRNERRYITKHLIEYDEFMEDSTGASEMVSAMHLRSKPIIAAFRTRERDAERSEGGRKRLFTDAIMLPGVPQLASAVLVSTPSSSSAAMSSSGMGSNRTSLSSSLGSSSSSSSSSSLVAALPSQRERLVNGCSFNPFAQPSGGTSSMSDLVEEDRVEYADAREEESQRYSNFDADEAR